MRNNKKIFMKYLLIIILFSLITFCTSAQEFAKNQINPVVEVKDTLKELERLSIEIADLKTRSEVFKKEVETFQILLLGFGGLISLVLILGTSTSLISWRTDRKRSGELYQLALAKEKEVSERDRSLFTQSSETLDLVNQTLMLAKDASERASKSLRIRLDNIHSDLEHDAKDIIEESKAYKNYKVLVEEATVRSNLETLAIEIAELQTNLKILEDNVQLKPFCSFIRGMHFHLHQHFKTAVRFWKPVKDNNEAPGQLKIMALYWIGYEQNNTMDFDNAITTFEEAAGLAKGAQKYELERSVIESKFSNYPGFSPESLLPEIKNLYKKIKNESKSDEFCKVKSNICLTLGNIYLQLGRTERYNKDKKKARCYYEKAKESFESAPAPIKNKWIHFGLAEAYYRLGNSTKSEKILLENVLNEAQLEYSNRIEPRTKVLGLTTVLICSMWIKSQNPNVNTQYNLLKQTIGPVDRRLSVFSQIQKRNVSQEKFLKEDLEELMKEFRSRRQLIK